MKQTVVSKQTLPRLTQYLSYLKTLQSERSNISATCIAAALNLNQVQVRKDLASVSSGGRPKVGYEVEHLIRDLEQFLGYRDVHSAIIAGAGRLGKALLGYEGFSQYGLEILAAFDKNPMVLEETVCGKQIFPMEKMADLCSRMQVNIGIIAVPTTAAQEVCDHMVASGILAIWNFAPTHLNAPSGILIQNENMAASLSVLSQHLTRKLNEAPTIEEF